MTGTFRFDELETLSTDGRWAIWTAYEGEATVNGAGQIIEIKVLARDTKTGESRLIPIHKEDGDIWTDIVRSLGIRYVEQITEAANDVRIARTIREYARPE